MVCGLALRDSKLTHTTLWCLSQQYSTHFPFRSGEVFIVLQRPPWTFVDPDPPLGREV